ncbi:MAG: EamA family transporter RarD [Actinobacteria bacterium]|nr:EamA family transporter RarD [Actinomycetota bacterium]
MDEHRRGLWYGVAAYGIWGVAPAFWKLLDGVPAVEQTAHRVVWSVPMLLAAVLLLRRRDRLRAMLADRRALAITAAASVLLTANWLVFVWAVASGRIVEASLGYFINPLLSVALGVVVLRERLRPAAIAAVVLAAAGVAYMTVRLGSLPWVSLVLAGSFAVYGLLKKRPQAAPPLEGLLGEAAVALPAALGLVVVLAARGDGAFGVSAGDSLLLAATGVVTVAPLLCFGAAVQRVPLSTVGLLQYLAPTLQFVLGAAVYGEEVTGDQAVGFAFVWLALAVFTADNLRVARRGGRTRPPGPGPAV